MKKILAILLAAALMFALAACGGTSNQIKDATTDEEAKEIILEGPSADTISEVFETEVEEPSPEETEAE